MTPEVFIRTCQECFYEQEARDPSSYPRGYDKWRGLLCRRCRSPALDYGSWKGGRYETEEDEDGDS
jgi:hypothetical protein